MEIISQKDINSNLIDKIIDICIENQGYLYTLRLAIQHPKISKLSLKKLLDSGLIAYDNDINDKYGKIIKNRLNIL